MTMHTMDCAALDERLADYLEGDLDPATQRELETHVATCVRCSALVRDLEQIRASAADLPELTPSRDLWSGIAHRIDTPVIPLAAQRTSPNVVARHRNLDRFKRAAIAAALVVVTAGVTYTLTVARNGGGSATSTVATNQPVTPKATAPGADTALRDTLAPAPDVQAPTLSPEPSSGRTPFDNASSTDAAVIYSREIDQLRTIFARNRAQLDPRTAAIIETNLKVIDEAIAQSKAALAQDPASRFLTKQLNSALDKKLELLRTAALLPNRT
jgi:hypothetical protein